MKWLGLVLWEVGNSWKFFCAITRGKKTKTRRRIGFVLFPCEIEKGGIFCMGPRLSLKKGKLNRGIICSGLVALWVVGLLQKDAIRRQNNSVES